MAAVLALNTIVPMVQEVCHRNVILIVTNGGKTAA